MKRTIITGAGGFVGRHLTNKVLQETDWHIVLIDQHLPPDWALPPERVTTLCGNIQDSNILNAAFIHVPDSIFHLAALPGGAAEQDPDLSKKVNLDATLALFERAAMQKNCPRVVYASSIAVFGAPLPSRIDDSSAIAPVMTYGTHKAMAELALADLSRRGQLDSVALRLPGIVARPLAKSGLKSAFLSNVFHALNQQTSFTSPVSTNATMWLMSIQQCAAMLFHGATVNTALMPSNRTVTLPALRVSMQSLVEEIAKQTDAPLSLVTWQPDQALEETFGNQPPLFTPAAEKAGFASDGQLATLVSRALTLV